MVTNWAKELTLRGSRVQGEPGSRGPSLLEQPELLELNPVLHYVYSAAFLCSSSPLSRRYFALCFLFPINAPGLLVTINCRQLPCHSSQALLPPGPDSHSSINHALFGHPLRSAFCYCYRLRTDARSICRSNSFLCSKVSLLLKSSRDTRLPFHFLACHPPLSMTGKILDANQTPFVHRRHATKLALKKHIAI